MKTSHRTLLLLGFLSLGILPASAFYNPSTGRWLSRDPIEEKGGDNCYNFLSNDSISGQDALGLSRLSFFSQGFSNFDPFWRFSSYERRFGESGNRETASAYFWQTATQTKPCPGGICNSGDPTGSSLVKATIKNYSMRCTVTVTCDCTIGYSVSLWNPTRNRAANAKGHVLGTKFHFSHMPEPITGGWYQASGYNVVSRIETFSLAPRASRELYFGSIFVATSPNAVGAGFSENMEGNCSCK